MDIRAAEISSILKKQIKDFGKEAEVAEIGQVLSVGDGIARVYGLDNVQAGEMVEFGNGIKGMALNLETDNVGVVGFCSDREIKECDTCKRTGAIVEIPSGKQRPCRLVDPLGTPLEWAAVTVDGITALTDAGGHFELASVLVDAPATVEANGHRSVTVPAGTEPTTVTLQPSPASRRRMLRLMP